MIKIFVFFFVYSFAILNWAQERDYSQQTNRQIKALSKIDVENYRQGKGMGFAKAAELNRFPGPKHVLELANKLNLSKTQIHQSQQLFNQMKIEAIKLGEQLIEAEKQLDNLFSRNNIDETSLKTQLGKIAQTRFELRFVHLNTHLKQKALLSNHQIHQYDQLRGYTTNQHQHNYQS